jgi:hypothetical protein
MNSLHLLKRMIHSSQRHFLKCLCRGMAIVALLLTVQQGMAQSARWAVKPTFQSLMHYGQQTYKVSSGGKVGVINATGAEILPAAFDSITNFVNGYALALTNKDGKYKIERIINEATMDATPVSGVFFLTKYPAFHEEKLCVKTAKGDEGFLGSNGKLAIECKYAEVHPFSEDMASVKQKNQKVIYIFENGSPLIGMEPGEGVIYFGSSFKNGEAVVYARGTTDFKGYVINKTGNVVRNYDVDINKVVIDDNDYTLYDKNNAKPDTQKIVSKVDGPAAFSAGGKYGFKTEAGVVVLPPQFNWAEGFVGGYAIVNQNAKYGLLKLINGSVSGYMNGNTELKVTNGKTEGFKYMIKLPEELQDGKIEMTFADVAGKQKENASSLTSTIEREFPLSLTIDGKPSESDYQISVQNDGLCLWKGMQRLSFSYGPSFTVTGPFPSSIKAGPNDRCEGPSVTIRNNTNITQKVLVHIYGGPVKEVTTTIEIPANGSRTVSTYAAGITQTVTRKVYVEAGSFKLAKDITFASFY